MSGLGPLYDGTFLGPEYTAGKHDLLHLKHEYCLRDPSSTAHLAFKWVSYILEPHSHGTRQASMLTTSGSTVSPSSFILGTESRTDTEMSSSGVTRYRPLSLARGAGTRIPHLL